MAGDFQREAPAIFGGVPDEEYLRVACASSLPVVRADHVRRVRGTAANSTPTRTTGRCPLPQPESVEPHRSARSTPATWTCQPASPPHQTQIAGGLCRCRSIAALRRDDLLSRVGVPATRVAMFVQVKMSDGSSERNVGRFQRVQLRQEPREQLRCPVR